jgi:hypothetical protein
MPNKSQGIVRDERGQEQPADKERAQKVVSVEEKKKVETEVEKKWLLGTCQNKARGPCSEYRRYNRAPSTAPSEDRAA